jgi:hypothetical protein
VSIETPVQIVSSFDHFVTQWMSRVMRSVGSAVNCSHVVHDLASSTAPRISKLHCSIEVRGVGPAERTGKSGVRTLARPLSCMGSRTRSACMARGCCQA